jgi:hypothetical protein
MYNEETLQTIEQYAGLCFTPQQIAVILGIDADVFYLDFQAKPELKQAYNRGMLLAEAKVRKAIIELAQGGSSAAFADYKKMVAERNLSLQKDGEFITLTKTQKGGE